jgi:hypothetical protein
VARERRRFRVWQRFMESTRFVFVDETATTTNKWLGNETGALCPLRALYSSCEAMPEARDNSACSGSPPRLSRLVDLPHDLGRFFEPGKVIVVLR